MSAKTKYTDDPLEDLRIIPDFLPGPQNLVLRDEGIKVTIALSTRSVDFFKAEAHKYHTQYQGMIRRRLDAYVNHHSESATGRAVRSRSKLRGAG